MYKEKKTAQTAAKQTLKPQSKKVKKNCGCGKRKSNG